MKEFSGSSVIGIKKFYEKTNRFEARKFEDDISLTFIENGSVKPSIAFNHQRCPLCSSSLDNSILQFIKSGYKHWICKDCNGIYTNPSINNDTIETKVYGETPYPFLDSVNSETQLNFDIKRFKHALNKIVAYGCDTKGHVFDFGCGSGLFLNLCKLYGFTGFKGNDLLKKAVEISNNEYNLSETLLVNAQNDTHRIDDETKLIAMWEFLDHINEPQIFLQRITEQIKAGTFIIFSVRNSMSLAARVLREKSNMFLGHAHFNFWAKETIELILNKFNFELMEHYQYISEREPVKNYLNYNSIYDSVSNELNWLPSDDVILANDLGYKHVVIARKL